MKGYSAEWKVAVTEELRPVKFAAEEWIRLMQRMDPECCCRMVCETEVGEDCLRIGLCEPAGAAEDENSRIVIRVKGCAGV